MYGFEAINEAMGWQMTALGIGIVFLSLIVLAILISQLKNILDLIEKTNGSGRQVRTAEDRPSAIEAQVLPHPEVCPEDMEEVAAIWTPLFKRLEDRFMLRELYHLAEENRFPHPHLTISRLRAAGFLVPGPEGTFFWKHV